MSLFPPSWYQYQHEVPLFYSQLFLALDSNKNKGKNQQDAKSHAIACFQYSSTIRAMITVLTPAYNRAYILNNLYKSLCLQNDMDFEWVIVDDGSSDNTESIVKDWIRENTLFTIRYFKQENGGKHRALNKGISLSLGDYIFIVDSDDYLTSDAISFINAHISEIDDDKYAGIAGLRGWIGKDGTIGNLPENDTSMRRTLKEINWDSRKTRPKYIKEVYFFLIHFLSMKEKISSGKALSGID